MSDTDFPAGRPRFAVLSWVCRGGLIAGTEARHASCPHTLGHVAWLDDGDYRCECMCHRISTTLVIPSLAIAESGRMSPEDAEALIRKSS